MNDIRKRIYDVIDGPVDASTASRIYNWFMIIVIVASLIPLAFKDENIALKVVDDIAVGIFIIDYILRWVTADYKYNKRSAFSFLRYPISPMAIIDLLSILPSLLALNEAFRVLRVLRMLRAMRVIRVFKIARYSKSFRLLGRVIKESKTPLIAVVFLAAGYILVAALVIFNVEPESFDTFFSAVYWATVSLTTVGYGDIYAVSTVGQVITMISALFGIAIVALPAGIVTAGYMKAINEDRDNHSDDDSETFL